MPNTNTVDIIQYLDDLGKPRIHATFMQPSRPEENGSNKNPWILAEIYAFKA